MLRSLDMAIEALSILCGHDLEPFVSASLHILNFFCQQDILPHALFSNGSAKRCHHLILETGLTLLFPTPTAKKSSPLQAMTEECNALLKNGARSLVPPASPCNVIGFKWVLCTKLCPRGSIEHCTGALWIKSFTSLPVSATMRRTVWWSNPQPSRLAWIYDQTSNLPDIASSMLHKDVCSFSYHSTILASEISAWSLAIFSFKLVFFASSFRRVSLAFFNRLLAYSTADTISDSLLAVVSLILQLVNFRSQLQYEIILLILWDICTQSFIKWNPIIVIGSSPILNFSLKIRTLEHKRAGAETIGSCKYRLMELFRIPWWWLVLKFSNQGLLLHCTSPR
ncbi:hypothetical protein RJ641_014970 [Dillenia turbinata]|uniref:Uncharacterized protein n=1 Tax=Dillenia turbinata TaxID=194707 RepID=A0AAN8V260_9MAGN